MRKASQARTEILALLAATWPTAEQQEAGPFLLRDGAGGGKRVSCASLIAPDWAGEGIDAAAQAMRALGQVPLFMIWPDWPPDAALDAALQCAGYGQVDPVMIYCAPCARLAAQAVALAEAGVEPDVRAVWPPPDTLRVAWQAGGVGPARQAVMDRVPGRKAAIWVQRAENVVGLAFIAQSGAQVMLHALHIAPEWRRQGLASLLMRGAAQGSMSRGADQLCLAVAAANTPARAMYERLGLQPIAGHHYRTLA
jgi:ribosomal protein S18 acetylase RimI-like enzyme